MRTGRKNGFATLREMICLTGIMVFLSSSGYSFIISAQQKPSRQSSLEAFSKGDYEKAYSEFNELLVYYPGDPLYKYYSGVCLVNLKRDPDKAVGLLKEAQESGAAVRIIPSDVIFWLGRAQHLAGLFDAAAASYNKYTEQSGRKAARELGIPLYIQQCSERKGDLQKAEGDVTEIKAVKSDDKIPVKTDSLISASENRITPPVKSSRDTIRSGYDRLLTEALRYQLRADSLQRIIESQEKSLDTLNFKEKTELRFKIASMENLADSLQDFADRKFSEAQDIMNRTPFVDIQTGRDSTRESQAAEKKDTVKRTAVIPEVQRKDSVSSLPAKKEPVRITENEPVKVTTNVPNEKAAASVVTKPGNQFSVFEVIAKPLFKPDEKIEIDPGIPPGLIYRIQVAVFRNPVAPSYFKGISPVYGFKSSSSGLTVYCAGMFRRLADANKSLAAVRQKGFKDAFVTSFYEGKAVSKERAAILEKEWGKKPFISAVTGKPETPADTVPPTLSFRVEVMRSKKPVKDDVIEGISKTAGTRGLETIQLDDGTSVYLIGMFITYESAEEYTDLLIRNGYREARITAWLGKKEIPVDTARELFDRLK